MKRPIPLAAAALLAACSPTFDPASRIEKLRVLAVRAEPPDLAPASYGVASDVASLGALVAHPGFVSDPSRRAVVLHLACTPTPGDPSPTPCTLTETLADPAALLAGADLAAACAAPGLGAPGAVTFAGVESCGLSGCEPVSVLLDPSDTASAVAFPSPAYALPTGFDLALLPPGLPERVIGVEVVVLALALDAGPAALAPGQPVADACAALAAALARFRAEWPAREHVAAIKRIRVRGPDALSPPNRNPVASGIALGGATLPAPGTAPAAVAPGSEADLAPVFPGDPAPLHERYVECDAAGFPIETKTEEWVYSWFTTAGDLEDLHTRDGGDPERFTAPTSGRAVLYAVARDLRGGVAWASGTVEVAP